MSASLNRMGKLMGKTKILWVRPHLRLEKPPLVLLKGYALGSGPFCRNVEDMARDRAMLMVDVSGFGVDPEHDRVTALKHVFQEELDGEFWLAGSSFGAYLAARMYQESDMNITGCVLFDYINCTVTVIDGAGHRVMTERPKEVNQLVNHLISSK